MSGVEPGKSLRSYQGLTYGYFWNLLLHTGIRPKPATWYRMIPIFINTRIILMPLPILTDDTAVLQMESLAF